jgi:hypothetical protein
MPETPLPIDQFKPIKMTDLFRETSEFHPVNRYSARFMEIQIVSLTTILLKVMSLIQRTLCVFVPMSDAEHTA